MEETLEYKGYSGSIEFGEQDRVFYGRILGIDDLVNYEAATKEGLKEAFREAVEDYLITSEDFDEELE